MNGFASSYLGQLRQVIGNRLVLVPGTRIIIQGDDQRILLQERADFGVWGLPGGNAELGEDLITGIIREVEEETSLRIFDPKAFGHASDPALETVTYGNGDRTQNSCLNFYCRRFDGVAKVNDDESTDMAWFHMEQLPEMLPCMRASVHAYQRFLATGEFQLF